MEKVSDEAGYRVVAPSEIQAWLEEAAGMDPGDRRRILTGLTSGYRTLVGQTSSQIGGVNEEATLRLFDQTVLPFLHAGMVPSDWARAEGEESRRVTIQKDSWDYAKIGSLYELARLQLSLTGILGPKDLKKPEEAKGRLDEFKKKLAEMPASQRAQVERKVGPQMRQLEEMAAGGEVDLPVRILHFRSKGAFAGLDALLAAYAYQAGTMAKALDGDVSRLTLE